LSDLELIHFFNFYLAFMFLVGLMVRFRQYRTVYALVRSMPDRWPRLLRVIMGHHGIFLTWRIFLPALVALLLCVVHTLACRLIWPQARLPVGSLGHLWPAVPVIAAVAAAMVTFDVYGLLRVGNLDRKEAEKYFDQAEFWLKSWIAPVVKAVTFGWVNPRQMVNDEVRKALEMVNGLLLSSLWWISLQTGLRIACGLSMWLSYAWLQVRLAA
jgi:hypothetical protein